ADQLTHPARAVSDPRAHLGRNVLCGRRRHAGVEHLQLLDAGAQLAQVGCGDAHLRAGDRWELDVVEVPGRVRGRTGLVRDLLPGRAVVVLQRVLLRSSVSLPGAG